MASSCLYPFCGYTDKVQQKILPSASLVQSLYLVSQSSYQIKIEILQHGCDKHKDSVFLKKGKWQMCPSKIIVLHIEVLLAFTTLIVKGDNRFFGCFPIIGDNTTIYIDYTKHVFLYFTVTVSFRSALSHKSISLSLDEILEVKRSQITFFITDFHAIPICMMMKLLISVCTIVGSDIKQITMFLHCLDDFFRERTAVSTETVYGHFQSILQSCHDSVQCICLMKFHIGVSIPVFSTDKDSADCRPSRKISVVTLIGVFRVILMCRYELVIEIQVNS